MQASRRSARGVRASSSPGERQIGGIGNAGWFRLVDQAGEFQRVVAAGLALEGNRAGDDAAVEFRQDDIHREIGRPEAALGLHPLLMAAAAQGAIAGPAHSPGPAPIRRCPTGRKTR